MVRSYCRENKLSGTIGSWIGSMAKLTYLYGSAPGLGCLDVPALRGTPVPYNTLWALHPSNPFPPFPASALPRARLPVGDSLPRLGGSEGLNCGVLRYHAEQPGAPMRGTEYSPRSTDAATCAVAGAWGRITWTARCRRSSASSRTSSFCAPLCAAVARAAHSAGPVSAALARACGGAQLLWREQAQRHDRRLDRLDGEAHVAVSAALRLPGLGA